MIQENTTLSSQVSKRLFKDVRSLIEQSRGRVAQSVNSELVMLYWKVGRRVRKDILGKERSPYGKEIVQTVSGQLVADYGKGFSRSNLFNMVRFSDVFLDEAIVSTLSRQLGWSHFVEIIPIEEKNQVAVIPDKTRAVGECMIWNPVSFDFHNNSKTLDSRSRTRFARLLSGMTKNTKSLQLAK